MEVDIKKLVLDAVADISDSAHAVAHSISSGEPLDCPSGGGVVMNLTQAVMGVAGGLCQVAAALDRIADQFEKLNVEMEDESS